MFTIKLLKRNSRAPVDNNHFCSHMTATTCPLPTPPDGVVVLTAAGRSAAVLSTCHVTDAPSTPPSTRKPQSSIKPNGNIHWYTGTLVSEAGFMMENEKLQLLIELFGELKCHKTFA
jgi:hypothetical protein